jgi:hypothetical protein
MFAHAGFVQGTMFDSSHECVQRVVIWQELAPVCFLVVQIVFSITNLHKV